MFLFLSLITLTLLFILSAFWSVSEIALTSLSKYRVKKLIAVNKSLAETLRTWLKSPYYILTTILVGDTITSLVISFLATVTVLGLFPMVRRDALEFGTWLFVTFVTVVFAEMAPKIFGRLYPEKTSLFTLPFLSRLVKVIRPLVWPFIKLVKVVFPKKDLAPVSRLAFLSLEEIRGLISEADTTGALGKETSQMLQRVLRLGDMSVSQIMTPAEKIDAVDLDQDEDKFLDRVVETGRSRVPVYHGTLGKVAGFIHTKDLLVAWRKYGGRFTRDLIRPPYFVPHDCKVHDLLKDFQSGQTHLAFVNDAFGNLAGLIALEDVLEEIVGEILDEYDLKMKHT